MKIPPLIAASVMSIQSRPRTTKTKSTLKKKRLNNIYYKYIQGVFMKAPVSSAVLFALAGTAFAIPKHGIDFVVGVDGDFKAAKAAAAATKTSEGSHYIIFFPNGEYNLGTLTGDGNQLTKFNTSHVSFIGESMEGVTLFNSSIEESISKTATLQFNTADDIYMQDLTVQNKSTTCSENACRHVTIQQVGDKYVYKSVRLISGQDTYYTNKGGRTYWDGGEIRGTVDFICGDGDVFFEGTKLVPTRSAAVITAGKTTTEWGYVFNNAVIESQFNNYYLGRSWNHAKTVFLNTKMIATPEASGWQNPINEVPIISAEYNSMNGNGQRLDLSGRRRAYTDKNGGSANLNPVLSDTEAAKYTLKNVLGGSDSWAPDKLTEQVEAPSIAQVGKSIKWADNEKALCWVVFVNGKYHSNTTDTRIGLDGITEGSKVYLRAANSMGGLGEKSNEVVTVAATDSSVTDTSATDTSTTDTSTVDSIPPSPGDSVTVPGDTTVTPGDTTKVPGDTTIARIHRSHYTEQNRKQPQHLYTIKGQRIIKGRTKVMRALYGK